MLNRIIIKNLALISDAELQLNSNLNILSGETGAGKSIIVDALMLLVGGKYDKTMLSYGQSSGYVEGVFSVSADKIPEFVDDMDDGQLIVLRKFNSDGRSDIRINGKSATISMLKNVASRLVDICGQNEYQILSKKSEHAAILDNFASVGLSDSLKVLDAEYTNYLSIKKKLNAIGDASERQYKIDRLSHQINEIETANIEDDEESRLTELKRKIQYGEKIKLALSAALIAIDDESGAIESLASAEHSVRGISSYSDAYAEASGRLGALAIELDDVASLLRSELNEVDFNENELEEVELRLVVVRNITRKYGSGEALKSRYNSLAGELELLRGGDAAYSKLLSEKDAVVRRIYDLSKNISDLRKAGAKKLEVELLSELESLGMGKARFKVNFGEFPSLSDCEQYISKSGMDDIEFYLSPNVGQPLLPLVKIISGGEMSRFMLALKVLSSRYGNTETMIFDEIDTGISGKIGQEVSKKLAAISRNCQVLCVTHLSQIASMADTHYYIDKSDDGTTTETNITLLDKAGMVNEIARLSGGIGITANANNNARELKEWSDNYKLSLSR